MYLCLNRFLNVKVVVAVFNQEKALVGAFSVIRNLRMDLFQALLSIHLHDGSREQAAGSGPLHALHAAFRSVVLLNQRNVENKVQVFSEGLL